MAGDQALFQIQTLTNQHQIHETCSIKHIEILEKSQAEWIRLRRLIHTAATRRDGTLIFYTDRSLQKTREENMDMSDTHTDNFKIELGWYNVEINNSFYTRTGEFVSLTNPEGKVVLTALEISPLESTVMIVSDS